ncbi:MAG: dihydroneopterin aldolase [Crocinitomicaceae bacterium]|nr:dihydroneopterin aldolase [Crocinitomicaceae bacterium]
MKHIVEVNGIKLYAFHGCLPEEEKAGGNYTVDIYLETDFSEAASTDDLSKTVDYVIINKIVKQEMSIRSKLIEHVGQRIYNEIKKTVKNIDFLRVKVTKECPPINGDVNNVAIIIEE